MEIPRFTGKIKEFRTFIQIYDSFIHNNRAITNIEKMNYLQSYVQGEARDTIKHLPIIAENYESAYKLLTEKYTNRRKLIMTEVETLMKIPDATNFNITTMKKMYYILKDTRESLKNFKIDTASWDSIINGIVLPKLDPQTIQLFEQHLTNPRELPTYEMIINFLNWRIESYTATQQKSHHNSAQGHGNGNQEC